jgi:hypothetical protein
VAEKQPSFFRNMQIILKSPINYSFYTIGCPPPAAQLVASGARPARASAVEPTGSWTYNTH